MSGSKGATYDDILAHLGGLGRYQKQIVFLAAVACATQSLHLLITIFAMGAQDFRCAVPGLDNDTFYIQNEAHQLLLNSSIPFDATKGTYSQCYRYKFNQSSPEVGFTGTLNMTSPNLEMCTKWVYSTDVFSTSIISEFDLVCDREIYTSHANMMTMAGLMIGSVVGGALSDRFGRKKAFLFLYWVNLVASFAAVFVPSLVVFLVLRLVIASSCIGFFASACVMSMEMVSSQKRTLAGMIIMFGWSGGMFVLVFGAFLFRDWQTLQIVSVCPLAVIAVSYIWLFPESPRWLLSKGRFSDADAILKTMARVNKREIPDKMLMTDLCPPESSVTDSNDESDGSSTEFKGQSVLRLFMSPVLLFRLLVLAFGWLVNTLVYYGLTLNVGSIIEGDIHLNFFIMSVSELVSYILLVLFLTGPTGRKPVFCTCVLLGGLACLATAVPIVLETNIAWINTVLSNMGKFFITCSFALVWIYTPELIPTTVRQSGLGICSMTGRIGGIISPYIGSLGSTIGGPFGKTLPQLVFGFSAILCGILALFLPETARRKLPETVEEAEGMSWRSSRRKATDAEKPRPC
ncbi:hypothetical protein EGW08_001786 [Elysia chlorotica]|uniref:Major facilitator superfamily (MFS) profile domain-containing protein n=1 Tax=Elysia chlorotica TaxID=188477 RepID=A0A3S1BWI4_ELYCH|nr:hypothetical protein EGW08_001786 [Elysia chlorotica]